MILQYHQNLLCQMLHLLQKVKYDGKTICCIIGHIEGQMYIAGYATVH